MVVVVVFVVLESASSSSLSVDAPHDREVRLNAPRPGAQAEDAQLLGRMMTCLKGLAIENGSPNGFRTVVNSGEVGRQEVYHLHIHVLGGPVPLGSSASF